MARYAIINHLGSSQRFAVLVEDKGNVDAIGVSEQGKEWERWSDGLAKSSRTKIEQLLVTVGPHFVIDGPSTLSADMRAEFNVLAAEMGAKRLEKQELEA